MAQINKGLFLQTVFCPTFGWMSRSSGPGETTLLDNLRIEEGLEVHERARKLYPDALMISAHDPREAAKLTQKAIQDKGVDHILEATFIKGGFTTKADILERDGGGWKLIEVKSSTNSGPDLVDDMAYTAMVIGKTGLNITSCSLLLVSGDYRLGMGVAELFEEEDVTADVLAGSADFENRSDSVEQYLDMKVAPEPVLKWECRKCELYQDCFEDSRSDTIFELPNIRENKFLDLYNAGIFNIEDIPDGYPLTTQQEFVVRAVKNESPVITGELRAELESIVYPAYYLDFETMMTCLPLYPDTPPYTQVPTQYSIHVCSELGTPPQHCEYLADHKMDCRRELAERLIDDCGKEGSIITYSSFEKTIIRGLMERFPDLSGSLGELIERIVDLLQIIKCNYYDRDFHGSLSIKRTLPVLVPDMSYEGLGIAEGGTAMAAFAYLAKGHYGDDEADRIRADLLRYCELDTLAMVRLHEELAREVN